MMNKNRIGILGGSFNPVHIGHLILAQSAIEQFDLNEVLFMPCNIQPLKETGSFAAAEHRMAMLESAIIDNPQFGILDIEIRRGGTSYAIDSVTKIKELYPEPEICFIIGADTLPELQAWKDIYHLLDICTFVTLSRPGCDDLSKLTASDINLRDPWPERLLANLATGRAIDISSSDIRHRVAEGMSIRYLVPQSIEMYISEHSLYRLRV